MFYEAEVGILQKLQANKGFAWIEDHSQELIKISDDIWCTLNWTPNKSAKAR